MSRPSTWWYENVRRTIRAYPWLEEHEKQLARREREDLKAIRKTIAEVQGMENGSEILKIVNDYAWDGLRVEDTARKNYVSERTVKRRYAGFVDIAAKNIGYKKWPNSANKMC